MEMRLEIVVVPVADVDRAKDFYENLGWRLDADLATGPGFRVVQLTPPGSDCSVIFGTGLTTAAPGSTQGLQLVVGDIDAARAELADLAGALRRAEAAHGKYEQETGRPDPDWPDWYAKYMADEQDGQVARS
ncbi:MAG TPA: VOC family protein [Trebonia sp.]|nr:VOC family protein [Trebonia sp.]